MGQLNLVADLFRRKSILVFFSILVPLVVLAQVLPDGSIVDGDLTVNDDLSVTGDSALTGTLGVTGLTTLSGGLDVTGDLDIISGGLTLDGNLTVDQSITAFNVTASGAMYATSISAGSRFNPMTESQRDDILSPTAGDLIYNTDTDKYNYYDGDSWEEMGAGAGGSGTLLAVTTKTANYTITSSDNVVYADSTSGAFTLTLPTAASVEGQPFYIHKTNSGTNVVTIDGYDSETIEGASALTVAGQNEGALLISNGTEYKVHYFKATDQRAVEITSDTQTSSADTVIDVTGSTISSLPAGTWDLCYNVHALVQNNGASTNNVTGTIYITDSANSIVSGSRSMWGWSLPANAALGFDVSQCVRVTITSETSYKLRLNCSDASATGDCRVMDEENQSGTTGDDNNSMFIATRVR